MNIFSLLHRVYLHGLTVLLLASAASANAQGNVVNGQYLAKAGGCVGCHTVNKAGAVPFAGGRALETPFGIFYGPNITPDKDTGIGSWAEADFKRAIRQGERRDGSHYFPAFPYPSFTGMTDTDIQDLWAYLKTLPPAKQANREHELRFPYNQRFLVAGQIGLAEEQGKRYSWGYPAIPELEDHFKVFKLLPAVESELGMSLSTSGQLIPTGPSRASRRDPRSASCDRSARRTPDTMSSDRASTFASGVM